MDEPPAPSYVPIPPTRPSPQIQTPPTTNDNFVPIEGAESQTNNVDINDDEPRVIVYYADGSVPVRDILLSLQEWHDRLGHAGAHIIYYGASRWFWCKNLLQLCKQAVDSCVCQLIKPKYGHACAQNIHFPDLVTANECIHVDTYDVGIDAKFKGRKVR
jgi:hypothetical protein